jgi:methyl-accepting chemotaxis protein
MSAVRKVIEHVDFDYGEAVNRLQGIVEFSVDGLIYQTNDKFLSLIDQSKESFHLKDHKSLCDQSFLLNTNHEEYWNKIINGEVFEGELSVVSTKGRKLWFYTCYHSVFDSQGNPSKVLAFLVDITTSKDELKIRTDIMNLTSIVSESNLKGDITSINDKYIEVSQYSREELIGQPHNITRHPDMPKEVFKEMWATIGRGKIFRGVVKNRAKDGSPYYVDAVIAPVLGENGKPKKYLGVRYDITEAEIERQNMKAVIHAIDDSFAYVEFTTTGEVVTANKNFQKAMNYDETELKGKHHRIFCSSEFYSSTDYIKLWEKLNNGESVSGVFKRLDKNGNEIWLQSVYAPVADEMGRVYKVIKIAIDVTTQQKMLVSMQETASALSAASTELTATASQMSETADRTSQESQAAALSVEEVTAGVQTVATNIEEMVASIKEIARSTNESSNMARMTLDKAQESNATVTKLGVSSQEIGDVIKVISSIAQQTNLLALNATIEAARAGEAGKGFAVVANEVKELAKQTAKATDDITHKIGAIQTDTKSAVEAIAGISEAVEKLNGISGVIAAAVEEQTATTNEISRVVLQSKKGVENIADTMKVVSEAATESNASSFQTLNASKELSVLAEKLTALSKGA